MTTPTEPRDEQWLRALEARRDALDLCVPAADEALYKDLQRRLDEDRPQHYARTSWKRTLGFALAAFALGVVVARFAMLSSAPAARSMGPPAPEIYQYAQDRSPPGVSQPRFSPRVSQTAPSTDASTSSGLRVGTVQRPAAAEASDDLTRGVVALRRDQFQVDRTVRVPDPQAMVETVSREAIRLGMSVSVAKEGEGYRLYVSGFGSPITPEQQRLRAALSAPESTTAPILVLVEKSENVRGHPYDVPKGGLRSSSSPTSR
jgi:hypothetical protein